MSYFIEVFFATEGQASVYSRLLLQLLAFNSIFLALLPICWHYFPQEQNYSLGFDMDLQFHIVALLKDQLLGLLHHLQYVCQPQYCLNYQRQILLNEICIQQPIKVIQLIFRTKMHYLNKQIKFTQLTYKIKVKQLHFMREPTTILEYKQFCKALKLKVLKQKTTIESQSQQIQKLQAQIKLLKKSGLQVRNENDPNGTLMSSLRHDKAKNNTDNLDIESACGKNQVMKKFKNGACSFGITPQSVFRIADFTYKGQVQSDYFRQILSKINLGLSPMEISCLIYIFDQSCTGFINKDDFNDSLNAYKVSIQQSYLPYTNYCLQKLAKLVQSDRIQVMKFFQQMQGKNVNSVDINRFYQKLKSVFNKRLQNRQIIGAFNLIDLENDGIVSKKNFIYSVTSAINKLSNPSHSQIKKGSSYQDHVNPAFQRSSLSASGKKSAPTPFNDNNQSTFSTKIKQKQSNENQVENISSNDVIERIYNNYKITLPQIYEQICRTPLTKRLTLFQFKKILHSFKDSDNKIDYELSSILFKLIDSDQRGTIHYRQLINFYLHHQTDMSIIFHLIAIYFTNNDLNSEKFWNMFGVSSDSDISKAKFLQIMSKTFSNREKSIEIWQKLWSYFDKGRGIISVSQINKQLTKYSVQQ